jgi:putative phosphoesterase
LSVHPTGLHSAASMRIGLISDIHGNLPALEAVLARLDEEQVDRIICLGDVAVGPFSSESASRVQQLGFPTIRGNWDDWMAGGEPPCAGGDVCEKLLEMGSFWAAQLDGDNIGFLHGLEKTLEIVLDDGRKAVLFHGSPRSFNEPILAGTPTERVEHMLAELDAPVMLCGHTHVQMVRRLPFTLLVNPGSVGLPFREWPVAAARVCPWAEFGILDYDAEGLLGVQLRRTSYDFDAFIRYTLESGVPHAEWWTNSWSAA